MPPILTLGDLLRHGGERLVWLQPCSPYRYMEFLIEKAVQGKFAPDAVVEIGSGMDDGIKYLNLEAPKRVLVIDFNEEVIKRISRRYPKVETRLIDLTETADIGDLRGQWAYVICNSVVEHVIDDQRLVEPDVRSSQARRDRGLQHGFASENV